MKKEIQKYRTTGNIAIWRFIQNSKNYPGWNICYDAEGGSSLLELLELMDASEWSVKKEIQLTSPLQLEQGWITKNGSYEYAGTLSLKYQKDSAEKWQIEGNRVRLTIEFGSEKLGLLIKAIRNDAFDQEVSTSSNIKELLYFW